MSAETVNHPAHYGGADNPYEAIKVIEAWSLGFCLGNAVKYISRAGKKAVVSTAYVCATHGRRGCICDAPEHVGLDDLKKARWYLDREIQRLQKGDAL